MKYVYDCNGKIIELTDEETKVVRKKMFVVVCNKCCNIKVLHILRRSD